MCRARAERSRPRTAAPGRPLALVATLRQAVLHPLPLQVHLTHDYDPNAYSGSSYPVIDGESSGVLDLVRQILCQFVQ